MQHRPYGTDDNSYKTAGEEPGIRKLVTLFYQYMDSLPEAKSLRAMHSDDLAPSADKLTLFLCGWLGGERRYAKKYGQIRIPTAHQHLDVQQTHADAWLLCMEKAAQDSNLDDDLISYLITQLRVPCERILAARAHYVSR